MNMILVICVIFATLQVEIVFSCICMPMHPQQQYCRASYVITGRVISSKWQQIDDYFNHNSNILEGESPEDITWGKQLVQVQKNFSVPRFELPNWEMVYTVKVRQVFKSSSMDNIAVGQNLELRSRPQFGNLCGINLEERVNYVLGGSTPGHIQLCDWVQLYKTITRRQKQGLRRAYKKYCSTCKVFSCDPEFCNPPKGNNICVYAGPMRAKDAIEWEYSDCIARHSRCQIKGKRSRCRWQNNGEMEQCQSRYGIQKWYTTQNF